MFIQIKITIFVFYYPIYDYNYSTENKANHEGYCDIF